MKLLIVSSAGKTTIDIRFVFLAVVRLASVLLVSLVVWAGQLDWLMFLWPAWLAFLAGVAWGVPLRAEVDTEPPSDGR